MPKSHRPYPPAFRRQMFQLIRRGRTPEELAREFEVRQLREERMILSRAAA